MFRAIGRWISSLGHFITGRVDHSRRGLDTDPHGMRSQYDGIIRDNATRLQQYKDAVAGLIAQQENKLTQVKNLSQEVQRLENLKAGALAKAKSTVAALQSSGADKDTIHANADYQKCLAAYNDFNGTLQEKLARIADLEKDVSEYGKRIQDHKLQLQGLMREIETLKAERSDAVADVISSKQERELSDAIAGIGEDTAAAKLSELRQIRAELRAGARISRELAGTDSKAQEAEFLEYARTSSASNEFDQLLGLAGDSDRAAPSTEAATAEPQQKTSPSSLPE